MRSLRLGAALIVLAVAAEACSSSGATTAPAATVLPATAPPVASAAPSASTPAVSLAPSSSGDDYSGRYGGGDQASGSSGGGKKSPAPTQAGGSSAKIVDFGFEPASLTVKVGATVRWTNTGSAPHTVTADAGSFDSGTIPSGGTFSQTFASAGTFAYHCQIHASMTATVTVTP